MKVTLHNNQSDLPISSEEANSLVQEILKNYAIQTDEISLHFVDEKKISELHLEHFQDPSPTDCITFPIDSPSIKGTHPHILGEAFVCPKIAIDYSQKEKGDVYEELSLYIIHCLLHLIGYNDIEEEDKALMRTQEKICLDFAKKQNLLLKNNV